jgi:glycosyltransferase involved in cell wall biosynthesis
MAVDPARHQGAFDETSDPGKLDGLRTLAVMHLAAIGGPAISYYRPLEALAQHGELVVLVPGPGDVAGSYERIAKTEVVPYEPVTFPTEPRHVLRLVRSAVSDSSTFRRHLRRTKPDVVVVITTLLPAAVVAARLERTPVVVCAGEILGHGSQGRGRSLAGRALTAFVASGADRIVCCSHSVAAQFDGKASGKVEMIYPGIDRGYRDGDRAAARSRYGVPDDAFCIVVVGNISAGRGQDVLLRALPKLRARVPELRCLLVGAPHPRCVDHEYRSELETLVRSHGLDDVVRFTGFVDRVADVYAAADVVVNPARVPEGFGRVALEALEAGRPVVASRVGAIPEVLREGKDALLVGPDAPAELADAVVRLHTDASLRARLVVNGRRRVRELCGERSSAEAFSNAVEAAVRGRRVFSPR